MNIFTVLLNLYFTPIVSANEFICAHWSIRLQTYNLKDQLFQSNDCCSEECKHLFCYESVMWPWSTDPFLWRSSDTEEKDHQWGGKQLPDEQDDPKHHITTISQRGPQVCLERLRSKSESPKWRLMKEKTGSYASPGRTHCTSRSQRSWCSLYQRGSALSGYNRLVTRTASPR